MPYAEPTSPIPAPLKKPKNDRRFPNDSSNDTKFRSVSSPLPSIPRRNPSTSTSAGPPANKPPPTSPRHTITTAVGAALASMRSVDSLPRRSPLSPTRPTGGLGLHLYGQNHSISSTLTRDGPSSDSSDAPPTPQDKPASLPTSPIKSTHKHSPPRPSLVRNPKSIRERGLSASALTCPLLNTSPPRPATHMVRKKSGELVKSSLKQRSMSTPDLGRNKDSSGDEHDHLRERTKSVRFDDLGLESVVLFLREQRPIAVSKSAEPGSNDTPTETEDDNDTDFVHFRTRRSGGGSSRPETGKEIQIQPEFTVPRIRLDFGPGTQGILKEESVVLERVDMQNGSPLAMRGTVLVRNVSFQKWVVIRFTLDHWQTTSEVTCQHVSHIPAGTTGDEGWDRFSFTIRLEDYKRKIEERLLQLCARFSVDGREWWDSNKGKNYRFNFKRASIRKARSTPTPLRGGGSESSVSTVPLRVPRTGDAKSPRNWVFPRITPPVQRVDSPQQSPPPAAAFQPPSTPDVHSHLALKRYCAPSPPKSSPEKLASGPGLILELAPERRTGVSTPAQVAAEATQPSSPMTLVHGRPATSWPPLGHERSQSWSGKSGDSWQDSEKVFMSDSDEATGDATPRAARARSPESRVPDADPLEQLIASPISLTSASEDENESIQTLSQHRSTGDLRALMNGDSSLVESPADSNLSSPPTPSTLLPGPMSPAASMSTGDSSPVNTFVAGSPHEGEEAPEQRGRMLNAATYQEFLDKFCFFKSPPSVTTPLEDPYASHSAFSLSGYSSPSIYGYFGNGDPRAVTPTPRLYEQRRQQDAEQQSAAMARTSTSGSASTSTPRASPPDRSPAATTTFGPLPWTPDNGPPSLAAA